MDALDVLHKRVSASRLTGPEPEPEQLQAIYKAALRAADHALLRPWRFLVIRGQARERLGELFADAALARKPELEPAKLEKTRSKALRAPVIVVAISSPKAHPKVPRLEQDLSTGAAVQNMLNAVYAQGLGAIWRTGDATEAPAVREGLGVKDKERIIGFLYLGHVDGPTRPAPDLAVEDYFHEW